MNYLWLLDYSIVSWGRTGSQCALAPLPKSPLQSHAAVSVAEAAAWGSRWELVHEGSQFKNQLPHGSAAYRTVLFPLYQQLLSRGGGLSSQTWHEPKLSQAPCLLAWLLTYFKCRAAAGAQAGTEPGC